MPTLETSAEELLTLYPRDVEGLDVVAPIMTRTVLHVVYFQRNTKDPSRNWESYRMWQEEKERSKKSLPLPPDFAEIYDDNISCIEDMLINPEDKILLEFCLSGFLGTSELEVTANVELVRKHPDPHLNGTGKKFYQNLLVWLRERGYRFLTIYPIKRLETYCQKLGQVPIKSLRPDKAHLLMTPNALFSPYVHFLYEEDKNEFMVPE